MRGETIYVNKIEKTDAEWKSELSPEEFAVAPELIIRESTAAFSAKARQRH